MKNKFAYILSGLLGASVMFSGCDSFLDEMPDNRTELTAENVSQLLLGAYPTTSIAEMYEMYSDNTDAYPNKYSAFNRLQEDLYKWEDSSQKEQDSPYNLWESCYMSIAVCNQVLQVIAEAGDPANLSAAKGEALVCRAYNHFLLAATFCKAYSPNASHDLGIPYVTEVENTVNPQYKRGTLEKTYQLIEEDLLSGLPLIDETLYTVPKYHFNKKAAHAFAARFYLNYMQADFSNCDKVIDYATRVLGDNPALMLRDWQSLGKLSVNGQIQPNAYVEVTNDANLMLQSSPSYWGFVHSIYGYGERYAHGPVVSTETNRSVGPWGKYAAGADNIYYMPIWSNSSALPTKIITMKVAQYMQITDAVAQTGYGYQVSAVFTTDELLLARAEAYALKKNYDMALRDLSYWQAAYTKNKQPLTTYIVNDFYTPIPYSTALQGTVKKELRPWFGIETGTQENVLHAILHAHRILTLHEGWRWLDIKRYGIPVYRRLISSDGTITVTDKMDENDQRRAMQIPSDVISAGVEANPR